MRILFFYVARRIGLVLLVATASGCTAYTTLEIPSRPRFPNDLGELDVRQPPIGLPELAAHRFDPSDGLDMDEVAMVAVANNPELKLARDDLGVADAQVFAAGLLPDPQLTFTQDFLDSPLAISSVFAATLSYDVRALLLRSSTVRGVQARRRSVNLALLWQEWQVVGQTRLVVVRILQSERSLEVLRALRDALAWRQAKTERALAAGDLTLEAVMVDYAALQVTERRVRERERQEFQDREELNRLLGLAPGTALTLTGGDDLPPLDTDAVLKDLEQLPRRRPDLMALRAGYESQDERYRQAIVAQFPDLRLGLRETRDKSNIYGQGWAVSMSLPVFNRNRGNVRIEAATRDRLRDEVQVRLNTAYSDVVRLLADHRALHAQIAALATGIARQETVVEGSGIALRAGHMNAMAYTQMRLGLLNQRLEYLALAQAVKEQRVALETIIGHEIPAAVSGDGR